MNLYIFIESSIAEVYGIGTYIRELTVILRHSSIKVCVVNLMSDKPQLQTEKIDNIRYLYFPKPIHEQRSIFYPKQKELYFRNVLYLLQLHIEDREDLIFHLNYNESGKLAEELKKVFDCRIVTTIHYFNWSLGLFGNIAHFREVLASEDVNQSDRLKNKIVESYRYEKALFDLVDTIICLSENTRQILQDDYQIKPNKIAVIYNGLVDNSFIANKQMSRKKYHIPDIPIIIFAGRLNDIKGLTYALRAFKLVLSVQPHCQFIIAGSGSFEIYMKECEDIWMHVSWTGLIDKTKLYELYSIANIGMLPSFHEQCSYVAIEMMMHGLPIIGSTTSGLKEMIVDGETGLHIPVIEYDDRVEIDTSLLAEKMLYLLQQPDERKRMGVNARKRYESLYTAEGMGQQMIALYKSL